MEYYKNMVFLKQREYVILHRKRDMDTTILLKDGLLTMLQDHAVFKQRNGFCRHLVPSRDKENKNSGCRKKKNMCFTETHRERSVAVLLGLL